MSEPALAVTAHDPFPDLYLAVAGQKIAQRPLSRDVFNPATGHVIGRLPVATAQDIDAALAAAQQSWPAWRALTAYERAKILNGAAELMRSRRQRIARVMTMEQGKVVAESLSEVDYSADVLQWYAEEGRRAYGRIVPPRVVNARSFVMHDPVGPVAAFTPWNFPALTPVRKLGGALAAGCPIILKPAEETPGTVLLVYEALRDAGLPDGVVNILFGDPAEISTRLIASPIIRKVTFTGSTPVGRHLAQLAGREVKRITLELGGHAPVIVAADADIEAAVKICVAGKYRNSGQVCVSPTRFIVETPAYDKFVAGFADAAKNWAYGDGLRPESRMGPMANLRRVKAMAELVPEAISKGAKLLAGGKAVPPEAAPGAASLKDGFFFQPTVLADVSQESRIMNEEPFGPVAPITRVASIEDAIAEANRLPWGLAAYAFTTSLKNAEQLMARVETGMLGINHFGVSMPETPFGGVKDSGYGSEGGIEGLDAYLTTKFVSQLA